MSDALSQAGRRLAQVKDMIMGKTQAPNSLPWDPEATTFPLLKDLPKQPGHPDDAAWVWGKSDYRGRLNLLTPTRVKAASSEIKTGETVRLDLPLSLPLHPSFGRQPFQHEIKTLAPNAAYDDTYTLNTQSGTQWDGFRHMAHQQSQTFYNNTKGSDIVGPSSNQNCSIHHWSEGNFSGRGVLLDYRRYAESQGIKLDTATDHAICHADLVACGHHQGIDIRPVALGGDIRVGDILLIRTGWVRDYHARDAETNKTLSTRKGKAVKWMGVKQEPAMIEWLHDCYFAAVAGDSPTFERWPTPEKYHLHEYILALWGMPLGEMLDLEKLAELAEKNKRWTFFFTSAPAIVPRGVASHVNGTAIF